VRRVAALLGLLAAGSGCSLGAGSGDVVSKALFAHDCWGTQTGPATAKGEGYDLLPDFFAAVPYRSTLTIRVQRGTDLTEVSDGLEVLIDDICKIRATLGKDCITNDTSDNAWAADAGAADAGATGPVPFKVSVPAGVVPPGSPPVLPKPLTDDPPIVHMSLYLQRSCHNQNIVLYGVDGTITFTNLFDGDPNETSADEKLTEATFDAHFGDLRDVPLGSYAYDVPAEMQSHVTGKFRFYFERGQPGQPFP
jgi:hypothetical protein